MPIRVPSPGHPRLCENMDPVPSFKSAEWTATTRLKQDLPYASSYISVSGRHLRSVVHSIVGSRLCQAGCNGTSFPPALNHPVEISGQANGWARACHDISSINITKPLLSLYIGPHLCIFESCTRICGNLSPLIRLG